MPLDAIAGVAPYDLNRAKVQYINALLKVGFDTIDLQFCFAQSHSKMADTKEVLTKLDLADCIILTLAIIANMWGH